MKFCIRILQFGCCFSVEPPEVVDPCDHKYPDSEYRVDNLEMPEPILSNVGTEVKFSQGDEGILKTSPENLVC